MTQDTIAADQSAENTPETIGSSMQDPRAQRELKVVHSSLWAAYGDALGWISELTDEQGLTKRTRGASLRHPIAWQRKIGGRYGVKVNLPVGCYSDDTQLRLATSRALSRGWFDVELFSKIELPVWLSYKFGAGRATSRASGNLARRDTAWYANFFKGWRNSGGGQRGRDEGATPCMGSAGSGRSEKLFARCDPQFGLHTLAPGRSARRCSSRAHTGQHAQYGAYSRTWQIVGTGRLCWRGA